MRIIFKVAAVLLLPFAARAQVAPEIAKKFKANIVSRIYEVTSKVPLSFQKQLQLGMFFKKMDSLANVNIAKGASLEDVSQFYVTRPRDLKPILSPIELNDYTTLNYTSASKLAVAIKFRKDLKLTPTQVDSLLLRLNAMASRKPGNAFDVKGYEAESLGRLLNAEQCKSLMMIICKDRALFYTAADWQALKDFNLVKNPDSVEISNQNFNYEIVKQAFLNRPILAKNAFKDDSIRKSIDINKPRILLKLDAYKNTLPQSEFAYVSRYRKEIALTDTQIDSLLNKVIQLEHLRMDYANRNVTGKYYAKPFETENLNAILTPQQWDIYLKSKSQTKAELNAQNDWAKLHQAGLTKELDSVKTHQENFQYELNLLVATERLSFNKSQRNAFAVKDIEASKPSPLKKLDMINKNVADNESLKRTLAW